jgi:uncharacterized membrane protein SirB2
MAFFMYLILKNFHMTFAMLAISGFLLRGYWLMIGSALRQHRASKIVPHFIDALFLGTGIWLIVMLNLPWMQQPWLLAKFVGLLGYIGFGMVAFRFGKTPEIRSIAFVAAVASFAYIVGTALTKSPLSWIAL